MKQNVLKWKIGKQDHANLTQDKQRRILRISEQLARQFRSVLEARLLKVWKRKSAYRKRSCRMQGMRRWSLRNVG